MESSDSVEQLRTRVGPYDLLSQIGEGGMGTVFRGEDRFTGRVVAIKFIHRHLAADPSITARFLKEARSAVSLRHPNVVDVLHMNEEVDGTIYMVLEYLEGEPLRALLSRSQGLPLSETLRHLLPIMKALVAAHERGIVHRDIKPDNIFLSRKPDGRTVPKLLDFGIAKTLDSAANSTATQVGSVMGSPAYMSPEQALGSQHVGFPTDVWAVGVVLYECLTGQTPFDGDTSQLRMLRLLSESPVSLASLRPDVPLPLVKLVEGALQKAPTERPTMATLLGLLSCMVPNSSESATASTMLSGIEPGAFPSVASFTAPPTPSELDAPVDGAAPATSAPGTFSGSLSRSTKWPLPRINFYQAIVVGLVLATLAAGYELLPASPLSADQVLKLDVLATTTQVRTLQAPDATHSRGNAELSSPLAPRDSTPAAVVERTSPRSPARGARKTTAHGPSEVAIRDSSNKPTPTSSNMGRRRASHPSTVRMARRSVATDKAQANVLTKTQLAARPIPTAESPTTESPTAEQRAEQRRRRRLQQLPHVEF